MKKLVLISALVLCVASFTYATVASVANTNGIELTDDTKTKEAKTEKKDDATCDKEAKKDCCKKSESSSTEEK
jgi:hypothetical protein